MSHAPNLFRRPAARVHGADGWRRIITIISIEDSHVNQLSRLAFDYLFSIVEQQNIAFSICFMIFSSAYRFQRMSFFITYNNINYYYWVKGIGKFNGRKGPLFKINWLEWFLFNRNLA